MFLKKLFKYIGILCVFASSFSLFFFFYMKYKDREKHISIIEENRNKNGFSRSISYLEIPDYHIKRVIKRETTKKILDDGYVVIWNEEKDLEKIGNLLLAGHNIQNVFQNLSKIKKGTKVFLHHNHDVYIYEVVARKMVGVTENAYLEDTPYKQLSLITCTKDNQVRLFVICSFQEKKSY